MPLNALLCHSILWASCFIWLPHGLAAQESAKLPIDLIELLGELDEKDQENFEDAMLEAEQAKPQKPPKKAHGSALPKEENHALFF